MRWFSNGIGAAFIYAIMVVATHSTLVLNAQAQLFETKAANAILMDVTTRSVLFNKNADESVPPASLAKLMTMEVVFHALKTRQLLLDDTFQVSENAWRRGGAASGGSTMFAELNSTISVEDLIRGVIVQSANDGCIILAEGMAGTEETFASLMNERAKAVGLKNSVFVNSTGLPDPGQRVTMRDLVTLATYMQSEYPEYYRYYSETAFEWNNINQRNRNPLLNMDIGADGMKTGFTEESGYAIVGSTVVDGRRLVVAMSGMESQRERAQEARKLLEWGRRAFDEVALFSEEEPVGNVRMYGGADFVVPVAPEKGVTFLVPIGATENLRARIVFEGPVLAPVLEGDEIAELHLYYGDDLAQITPLYAAKSVERGPIHRQALDALSELVLGWF
ncbi:MAG: D-alanyl-D-alanine carboxypeptidase family protein [Pseudomonadota bacterium]